MILVRHLPGHRGATGRQSPGRQSPCCGTPLLATGIESLSLGQLLQLAEGGGIQDTPHPFRGQHPVSTQDR